MTYDPKIDPDSEEFSAEARAKALRKAKAGGAPLDTPRRGSAEDFADFFPDNDDADPDLAGGLDPFREGGDLFDAAQRARQIRRNRY